MKVVKNNIIPFRGFAAINLFGIIFVRKDYKFRSKQEYLRMMQHEAIHSQQMQELLYLPFYILYLSEWLIRLIIYRKPYQAYRNISFEREAYHNQDKTHYIQYRKRYAFIYYFQRVKLNSSKNK